MNTGRINDTQLLQKLIGKTLPYINPIIDKQGNIIADHTLVKIIKIKQHKGQNLLIGTLQINGKTITLSTNELLIF